MEINIWILVAIIFVSAIAGAAVALYVGRRIQEREISRMFGWW